MPGRRFETLLSRLEARGVPRAVSRRIGAELADHFDLLVQEERSRGAGEAAAWEQAAARIGSEAQLYEQFMADPRIVPLMRQRPVTAFLLAPVPVAAGALAIYALAAIALVRLAREALGLDLHAPAFAVLAAALFLPAAYGLVTGVAWWFCRAARAAECRSSWPLMTCAILAIFGGVLSLSYVLPAGFPGSGQLFVGFSSSIHWPRLMLPLMVFAAFQAWPVARPRVKPDWHE